MENFTNRTTFNQFQAMLKTRLIKERIGTAKKHYSLFMYNRNLV